MTTSYNGWTAGTRDQAGVVVRTVPGTSVALPVSVAAADVLVWVADQFNRKVEPLRPDWCWGWANRTVRGSTTVVSNHASGTAIDLNAPKHPRGTANTFTPAQVQVIRAILEQAKVVTWGGDYKRSPIDEMHFEISTGVTPDEARQAGVRLTGPRDRKPPTLRPGTNLRGWTRRLQAALNDKAGHVGDFPITVDGVYGPATVAAVKRYKRRRHMFPATGTCGSRVWRSLGIK